MEFCFNSDSQTILITVRRTNLEDNVINNDGLQSIDVNSNDVVWICQVAQV